MNEAPPELLIVMPVFNEQTPVCEVVTEWFQEVENWTDRFVFVAINDGSTDGTLPLLRGLRERLGPRLEIIDHANIGHGQCCLEGYRLAAARRVPYVFQIDSDGQCDPRYFPRLWQRRETCDVIYGRRTRRDDGWRRKLASIVVRVFLLALFQTDCVDANVPYRLMRTDVLGEALACLPGDFSLANIGLAVLLRRDRGIRHSSVPIGFRERSGGEPKVRLARFGAKARELYRQLRALP